jgi:hypothetical protein
MIQLILSVAMMLVPVVLQVFIIHLGVYYGMRRFTRWGERRDQKTYNKIVSAKDKR